MARAHRHHLAGQIWHLTHRCHQRQFLLKFARGARTKADGAAEPLAESIGVGSRVYIEALEKQLAIRSNGRDVISLKADVS
jgi:hypothetical protein